MTTIANATETETSLKYSAGSDANAWDVIRRGNMRITVANPEGDAFTYQIKKDKGASVWYVSALRGPDNVNDYCYIGMLVCDMLKPIGLRHTKGSRFPATASSFKIANWALFQIRHGYTLPEGYKILLSGRCRRCGRVLTTVDSVESGIGPVCAGKEGGE